MTSFQIETQLIASLVAIACVIPGVFLVLRKMALISDAISHSVLPGFVIGFFISHDVNSPILIFFGALFGVLTVVLVEYIQKTKLVKEDTAIGLVFPALFSIGVLMISKNASDVHLDMDAVLVGELAMAPLDRVFIDGVDYGPKALWTIGTILLISASLLFFFFKELKISTFDVGLAASLGFSPVLIHYVLMTVSSVTIVGSFDAVGAILVIALMIAPSATAYMLTNDLKKMLFLAMFFGVFASISGYWIASILDTSIAGSMTAVLGIVFLLVYLFAPRKGVISVLLRNKQQSKEVLLLSLLTYLKNHIDENNTLEILQTATKWSRVKLNKVIKIGLSNQLIDTQNSSVILNDKGLKFIDQATKYIISNNTEDLHGISLDLSLFKVD